MYRFPSSLDAAFAESTSSDYLIWMLDGEVYSAGVSVRSDVQKIGTRIEEEITGVPKTLSGHFRMRLRKILRSLRREQ